MTRESYHGWRIDHEPDSRATKSYRDHVFQVFEDPAGRQPTFSLLMRVHWHYAIKVIPPGTHPLDASVPLAERLGLRWVHGLIDLGRVEQGRDYEEERTDSWEPEYGAQDLDDARLRVELLGALQRMNRAQQRTSEVLSLDVGGVADVLGTSEERVRGVLGELLLEGLVQPVAETYGHSAVDGACAITGEGLRELRIAQVRGEAAEVVHVEDIDSFAKVRAILPSAVASMLPNGLLPLSEVEVKKRLCAIIGEKYEHKDWGGERSDVFTTQVRFRGQRVRTAMLLKGPAVGKVLYPSGLGHRADQDLRLFTEPAELFLVQFNGRIDSSVLQRLLITADHRARQVGRTLLCVVDGVDTARMLRAYGLDEVES